MRLGFLHLQESCILFSPRGAEPAPAVHFHSPYFPRGIVQFGVVQYQKKAAAQHHARRPQRSAGHRAPAYVKSREAILHENSLGLRQGIVCQLRPLSAIAPALKPQRLETDIHASLKR